MPKIIVVGGTHATGKTTTIQKATARINRKKPGSVKYLRIGDELRKYLKQRDLGGLTAEQLRTPWQRLFRNIQRRKSKIVILDDHYTYTPCDSSRQMDLWKARFEQIGSLLPTPIHFVLLEAPVKEIKRRVAMGAKPRPQQNIEIAREIVGQRICARLHAKEKKRPLTIIRNADGEQAEAIRKIEAIVCRHL